MLQGASAGPGQRLAYDRLIESAEQLCLTLRPFPAKLAALLEGLGLPAGERWSSVSVTSLISRGGRRLHFSLPQVLEASLESLETGKPIRHGAGTTFVAHELATS